MGKRFHIKITDNQSGAVLREGDTGCLIGAIDQEDAVGQFCYANATTKSMAMVTAATMILAVETMNQFPPNVKKAVERTVMEHVKKEGL